MKAEGFLVYRSDAFYAVKNGLERESVEDWKFAFLPQATDEEILDEMSRFLKANRPKELE
jgi:hypothetical protein